MPTLVELLVTVRDEPRLATQRAAFLAAAREAAAKPIIRRAHRLADVGTHRTWLDGRAQTLEPEIQETFALAMSDHGAGQMLVDELPLLAAAHRLTGAPEYRARVLAQLDELAGWSPLQRPGWSCCGRGARLPADGKDGAWLATGTTVRALADTLELLAPGDVPVPLRARLDALLAAEIAQVVDDWRTRRPWFVRANNPITNQWVLPTEGLVRACLVLGPERHRAAYELGVANLLAAFNAHGAAGEFEEGYHYAAFTVSSFLAAARAMGAAGDRRLLDHPYLQRFPTWLAHHLMPGRLLLNAFDCFSMAAPRGDRKFGGLLAQLAVGTGSPVARWLLGRCFTAGAGSVAELLAHALPAPDDGAAPPLFAAYERAPRVNWRDTWDDAGSGVWVRGGHATDQHDHQDRGHVNFSVGGRPLLIEAGTPAYHHPRLEADFASARGHNVLQLGDALPKRAVAPLTVHRLAADGGDVTVDATAGYAGLTCWRRRVTWTARELTVADTVEFAADRREVLLFRWHLGSGAPVAIAGDGTRFTVTGAGVTLVLAGSAPLLVTQELMPDNSVVARDWDDPAPDHLHPCVVMRTATPVERLTLTTCVRA